MAGAGKGAAPIAVCARSKHVVRDVKDTLAARLEILISGRRMKRTQHEPRHAQIGIDPRAHGRDVERAVEAQRCHDPFKNHARASSDSSISSASAGARSVPLVSLARTLAPPREVADFRFRQEAPFQRLILTIGLAQRQGGFRLHQLVAEVKRMRGVGDAHLLEEDKRIGIAEKPRVIEGIDHPAFGEDPPVGVADSPLKLGEVVGAEINDLWGRAGRPSGARRAWARCGSSRHDEPAGAPDRALAPTTAPS